MLGGLLELQYHLAERALQVAVHGHHWNMTNIQKTKKELPKSKGGIALASFEIRSFEATFLFLRRANQTQKRQPQLFNDTLDSLFTNKLCPPPQLDKVLQDPYVTTIGMYRVRTGALACKGGISCQISLSQSQRCDICPAGGKHTECTCITSLPLA